MPVFIPLVAQTSIPATPPAQQAEPPKASSESGAPHPCGNPERPISSQTDYKAASRGAFVWTPEHDARLTELKDVNTPWISISIAMDRPVHELKKRWHLLRAADVEIERRTAAARKARVEHDRRNPKAEDLEHRTAERTVEEEKPKRRVSFSDPLIIPGKVRCRDGFPIVSSPLGSRLRAFPSRLISHRSHRSRKRRRRTSRKYTITSTTSSRWTRSSCFTTLRTDTRRKSGYGSAPDSMTRRGRGSHRSRRSHGSRETRFGTWGRTRTRPDDDPPGPWEVCYQQTAEWRTSK